MIGCVTAEGQALSNAAAVKGMAESFHRPYIRPGHAGDSPGNITPQPDPVPAPAVPGVPSAADGLPGWREQRAVRGRYEPLPDIRVPLRLEPEEPRNFREALVEDEFGVGVMDAARFRRPYLGEGHGAGSPSISAGVDAVKSAPPPGHTLHADFQGNLSPAHLASLRQTGHGAAPGSTYLEGAAAIADVQVIDASAASGERNLAQFGPRRPSGIPAQGAPRVAPSTVGARFRQSAPRDMSGLASVVSLSAVGRHL